MDWSCRCDYVAVFASSLDAAAVDAWGAAGVVDACAGFVTAFVVDVFEVEGVDVAGEVAETCEEDVDEEIDAAACD